MPPPARLDTSESVRPARLTVRAFVPAARARSVGLPQSFVLYKCPARPAWAFCLSWLFNHRASKSRERPITETSSSNDAFCQIDSAYRIQFVTGWAQSEDGDSVAILGPAHNTSPQYCRDRP